MSQCSSPVLLYSASLSCTDSHLYRATDVLRTGEDLDTKAQGFKIKRIHQPARSPDLNALDLYVWRILEAGVHKRRPKTLEALWEALEKAWEEDLTEAKIECAFRLLKPVMACIKNDNGGNLFKLPHSGIRKEMRADGWDI